MGYSCSWLAIRGKSPQAVLAEVRFRPSGEREEIPESDLSAAELPNGWYLIVSNHCERVIPDEVLQRLCAGCEAVTCFIEEHVMVSKATGWNDGRRCWSVTHDAQKRRDHLAILGEPPPIFSAILSRLQSRQRDSDANGQRVDYIFDLPVELAQTVAGYRHDQDIPGSRGRPFEVLISSGTVETVPCSAFRRLNQKWMALPGWQRGIFGTLIIFAAVFILMCGITLGVMLFK
jgi:hypothetical protein